MIDYGHDLQFGVFVAPAAQSADHVVALSALAEEVGYDLVTFNDHPYSPGALDAYEEQELVEPLARLGF